MVIALKSQDTNEQNEEWGYVQVRPKAHMFWWLYRSPYRVEDPSKPWPIILWLQGGPGSSAIGLGNFQEIGPLDINMNPRNFTWLKKADLLFVENPVGTGYSYVEDAKDATLFAKTDVEAATDMTTLLIDIFNKDENLQKSPLYIVAESYGGKFAATLGLSALQAIEDGKLKLKLGGVALGDSWISPEDYVFSWGPLLKDLSRLDDNALEKSNSMAQMIMQQLNDGKFVDATHSWNDLELFLINSSNNVDFYNFLRDVGEASLFKHGPFKEIAMKQYSKHLTSKSRSSPGGNNVLDQLLNGVIKKKLKIIPENVQWREQADDIFTYFEGDYMKPRIDEVDQLLAKGVNVTVYNGQEDVICSTKGTEAWVRKLKWEGLQSFLSEDRKPIYCKGDRRTKGFVRSYKNLRFYWILRAGHYVPVAQPCIALDMVGAITQSPAT
ncbi:Serine carboxypeptidase, serine active site [Sesbania bispinosa]|nr:Serine carboxypeptidase, serine active site [Sesbania bispinosa]